jgi:hypothetical protein
MSSSTNSNPAPLLRGSYNGVDVAALGNYVVGRRTLAGVLSSQYCGDIPPAQLEAAYYAPKTSRRLSSRISKSPELPGCFTHRSAMSMMNPLNGDVPIVNSYCLLQVDQGDELAVPVGHHRALRMAPSG